MGFAITLPGGKEKTYSRLRDAMQRADKVAVAEMVELDVVDTDGDSIVYVASPVQGRRFAPWARVETPANGAPRFEGFRPAYQRKRVQATVYRSTDPDHRCWRVYDGRSGKYRDVKDTVAARELTNAMAKGKVL